MMFILFQEKEHLLEDVEPVSVEHFGKKSRSLDDVKGAAAAAAAQETTAEDDIKLKVRI